MTSTTSPETRDVRFGRVLRAEVIKATSVRAPMWTAVMAVLIALFFAGAIAIGVSLGPLDGVEPRDLVMDQFGDRPSIATLGIIFMTAQALVALVGTLLVSGERGTGLLRTTLSAVPRRSPVLVAKLLVSAVVGLVLGFVSALLALALLQPAFESLGLGASLWTPTGLQVLLCGAVALALLSTLSTALASLFRNTATAAGTVLGLLLIAPLLLSVIPVIGNPISSLLPGSVAGAMAQPADAVGWETIGTAALVLVGWTGAVAAVAGKAWKTRDL
jgi:ABC-2 type transport system permease protein